MTARDQTRKFEIGVEDRLADLLSDSRYEKELYQLFQQPAGYWTPILALCDSAQLIGSVISQLETQVKGHVMAAWVDYPDSVYGAGYCTVLFFEEMTNWGTIAIYNKARLERNGQAY